MYRASDDINHSVFLNRMMMRCTSMVCDLYVDYSINTEWHAQERDDLSLLAMIIILPDSKLEVWVRFTSTPEWFQLDCGPVSKRVSYSRRGVDIIDENIFHLSNWIRDYFDDPDSVDPSLLFRPRRTDERGFLWPVDGFDYEIGTMKPPTPIQSDSRQNTAH